MPDVMENVSGYLRRPFGSAYTVNKMIAQAKQDSTAADFDTVIGTGVSGALVAPLIARELGKFFAIARKDSESTPSYHSVEGAVGKRWILADDQIDSGATVRRVKYDLARECEAYEHSTLFVGAWLYACDEGFHSPEDIEENFGW